MEIGRLVALATFDFYILCEICRIQHTYNSSYMSVNKNEKFGGKKVRETCNILMKSCEFFHVAVGSTILASLECEN